MNLRRWLVQRARRLVGQLNEPQLHLYDIAPGAVVYDTRKFDANYGAHISIGAGTVVSASVRILAHDGSSQKGAGVTIVKPVRIGERCFIGADSAIMPGVTIGDDCVVGVGAVVTRDVPGGSVCAGVPARVIGTTADLHGRRRELAQRWQVFDGRQLCRGDAPPEVLRERRAAAERDGGYFVTWDADRL